MSSIPQPQQYKNDKVCSECKGWCCRIYAIDNPVKPTDMWFEEWCENFHARKESYGVEPLFEPLEVFMRGNEHMIAELVKRGINPDYCQYWSEGGCRIEWGKRPLHCRVFKCDKLNEGDAVFRGTLTST